MKTGTREWSDVSKNCCLGCSHNCAYCYARASALKAKRIKSVGEWAIECPQMEKGLGKHKYNGIVMFPTQHDITPNNFVSTGDVLKNLLEAGNQVLVVSKPHYEVMLELSETLIAYRDSVEFRFSIGSLDTALTKLWEPGAPAPAERVAALGLMKCKGYVTSVSMEPTLDFTQAVEQFHALDQISDTIWIGLMNHIRERVIGVPEEAIRAVETAQSEENIWKVYNALKYSPKVRWKDSISRIIGELA